MTSAPLLRDALLCVWILLVAAAFWGQYAAPGGLPANVFTALYAAFLVLFVAAAALRAVRGRAGETGPGAPRPEAEEARRGR